MGNNYQDSKTAQKYIEFLNSPDGKIQQDILAGAILPRLQSPPGSRILDAGCGNGWLTAQIKKNHAQVFGCDSSEALIANARDTYPDIPFTIASLTNELPYDNECFDNIILNMAAPDVEDLELLYKNIYKKLKADGQLLITIPNPYYTEPVAEWKRSLADVLFMRKPKLKIKKPYQQGTTFERNLGNAKLASKFYTMADYIHTAILSRFTLVDYVELKSHSDSPDYNLRYRMHRYPLLLLLEFRK